MEPVLLAAIEAAPTHGLEAELASMKVRENGMAARLNTLRRNMAAIRHELAKRGTPGMALCGAIMGTVLFRLLIAIALRWGLNPNDLKLVTALFVFAALVLPAQMKKMAERAAERKRNRAGEVAA